MTAECQRLKILVVDDEADTRIFLCNVLGTCCYEAIDAADGEEGLCKAKAQQPDLIILDIMMPGEKGIQMYRSLKLDQGLSEKREGQESDPIEMNKTLLSYRPKRRGD